MIRLLYLTVAVILCASCSPLKKTRRHERVQTIITDQSEIRKLLSQIINEQMSVRQRIVEYYPPEPSPEIPDGTADPQGPEYPGPLRPEPPVGGNVAANPDTGQAVRRVIDTEITTTSRTTTQTDSTARNDKRADVDSETTERIDEKPPPAVTGIKWTGVILICFIILILKLQRWFKTTFLYFCY